MGRLQRSIAVVSTFGLLISEGALAGGVTLDELRGFSLDAQITRSEKEKRLEAPDENRRSSEGVFALQIFVANSGRIFSRQGYSDAYARLHFDSVATGDTQELRFGENEGFIRINYDAPPHKRSTFAMVTVVAVSRDASGALICAVSMRHLLRDGETRYIKPVLTGETIEVLEYHTSNPICRVRRGNVFENSPS